ncbi:MAG TPA: HEAT repeat domain-containing protein [Verrucomicrobiae bacterium]|nr:HEAT repeat domain-containing protein [Verrucomicrobiae bacterium]
MKLKLLLCLVLVVSGGLLVSPAVFGQDGSHLLSNDWRTKPIASEADLNRVIAKLQNPATQFDAFSALLEFAGSPQGNIYTEDLKVNALHERAINALRNCPGLEGVIATMIRRLKEPDDRIPMLRDLLKFSAPFQMNLFFGGTGNRSLDDLLAKINQAVNAAFDPPTVEMAFTNSDWLLRIEAVNHFGDSPSNTGAWAPLLPQMEKLAADDDAAIRRAADQHLAGFPGTRGFLDERLTNETSADVILQLLSDRYDKVDKAFYDRFLALFVPLLGNPDEKVRDDALGFVAGNSGRAPIWQFPFGMNVFDRVVASTHAKSPEERESAADALIDIRKLDPDRSREVFLRLVNDPDPDVRWHIALGLKDQLEREDVKRAIAALLKDPSPEVRYMTILAVGPKKCVPELHELSKENDPWVAKSAAETLRQLANEKTN